jgi:hypothetical protein
MKMVVNRQRCLAKIVIGLTLGVTHRWLNQGTLTEEEGSVQLTSSLR